MNPKEALDLREQFTRTSAAKKKANWHREELAPDVAIRDIEPKKVFNWLLLSAVGLGFGFISLLAYGLTRPCVVGKCEAIAQAKLVQAPSANLTKSEIQGVQQQLSESVAALQPIPAWSPYSLEAKTLRLNYRHKLETLDKIVAALESEAKAKEQLQTPLSASATEIRGFWQEAIASLNQIPTDSEFFPFAHSQIQQYQQNLAATSRQLTAKRKAIKSLEQAKSAAEIAETRHLAAHSPADWQLVIATWDTAIKRLQELPNPDQKLLEEYQTQQAAAQKRKQQEQLALDKFKQGTEQAQQAKDSEAINQWTAAVTHWRNALNAIKQVPKNTSQDTQAQALRDSYTKALNRAQAQLQTAVTLQQARSDLEKVCSGTTKICHYDITASEIQVNLTSAYIQKVRQTALQAKAQDNLQAQVNLLDHIASVEQGLEAISNNIDLRVNVYSSQGALLVTYKPRR